MTPEQVTTDEPSQCKHVSVIPKFDPEQSRSQTAAWVRKNFPRFYGRCPDCGDTLIVYASFEHYISGDW